MKFIAEQVIKHKKIVLFAFILSIIMSAALSKLVLVNYDMISYLPENSPSTLALDTMNQEFTKSPPNARVLVEGVSIPEALKYKQRIADVEGVLEITWVDDAVNIYQPIESIDKTTLESYYVDNNALFNLVIDTDKANQTLADINHIIGEHGELTGDVVDTESVKSSSGSETGKMLMFLLPIILFILFVTTSSWFEPILFMATIGIAIIINNGTNIIFGEISFVTKSTSAILQLACSMDYSIFLLHRFSEYRAEGRDVKTAMINSMTKSFSSIAASGLTTLIGFLALVIMRFKIGPDLGIVLAKGIVFSMLTVMLLLPVLTIYCNKLIEKSHHRSFLPSFKKFGQLAIRLKVPVVLLVGIVVIPAFMAQNKNDFVYGASTMGSNAGGITKTEQLFGKANNMVLLVPKGDEAKEKALYEEISDKAYVSSVISYVGTVGNIIPQEFVPEDKLSELESQNYSRMVLTLSTEQESDEAFKAIEELRALGEKYYGDNYYLSGGSASVYDLKDTITKDNASVTLLSIIGIGIVILLTFRSIGIPLILLFTIETAVWVNLAVPYFQSEQLIYLGYLIISSIQLGATVDYAILFANRYIDNRVSLPKKLAAEQTVAETAASILTSAGILMIAGFIMSAISTNGVIGQLGSLIARGTLLSSTLVLIFLPNALMIMDTFIQKMTLHTNFYKGDLQ